MGMNDIRKNPLLLTDVYNLGHGDQKENVDYEVSHIYNRSQGMILYGLNEITINLLNTKIEVDMVEEAQALAEKMDMIFPFDLFYKIATRFGGRIPLRVQSLPEGTWCPTGTPFAQISNTEEGFGELVTWWESIYLHSYFASGCATEALHLRRYLDQFDLPLHRFHSFGFRGHHSLEDAYWASTAWNMFLIGSDDFHSIYHTPEAPIKSIPATAHKVIQQFDSEIAGFMRSIDVAQKYKSKMVALVIDTYDPQKVIDNYIPSLLQYAKDRGVHLVFRPDSGNLINQALQINQKYSNWDNWSMIIGEGMSLKNVIKCDNYLKEGGYPLERMAYGIGAGFYKHIDRDWLGHAMKTAYSNGAPRMKLTKSNPYKQSIPNTVNIVRDVAGDLVVDYTRDGEDKDGLFYDIYHFDERSTRPKTTTADWVETRDRAIQSIYTKNLQERIKLSPIIESSIQTFKEKYL